MDEDDLIFQLQNKARQSWSELVEIIIIQLDDLDTYNEDKEYLIDTGYSLLKEHRIYLPKSQRTPKKISSSLKKLKQKLTEEGKI